MKRKITFICASILASMILASFSVHAQSSNPQQTLNQYVADLQKSPNDYALRERIIRHVQTMKQKPAIPAEVVKHEGAAEYAFKNAKNESDYLDSAREYEKALLIAPWLAIDYFNCGVAYEKARQFKKAIAQFNLYLIAAPDAQDANAVLKRIGGLEYAAGKAGREPAAVPKKQNEFEEWLKKIDGRRYTYRDSFERITQILDVKGRILIRGFFVEPDSPVHGPRGYTEFKRYEIRGRVVEGPVMNAPPEIVSIQDIFTISEDGEKIHLECRLGRGKGREYDYYRQR